ncbi:hypothetical protein MPER_12016, partial [Moniliophthora perniciosa FA553]
FDPAPAPPKQEQEPKSWENFFGGFSSAAVSREPRTRAISKPTNLRAFSGMGMGKETLVSDGDSRQNQNKLESQPQEKRSTAWFGKFAGLLGKKNENAPSQSRPNLRISTDRSSSMISLTREAEHSRWSTSPPEQTRVAPWVTVLSPTRKNFSLTSPPVNTGSVFPKQNIPVDVNSVYESSERPLNTQPPLAPPLHHGFNATTNTPNVHLSPPPRHPHRRSSSVPAWKWRAQTEQALDNNQSGTSVTPVTRILTSNPAMRESGVFNPFATPFDDEHR